MKKETKKLLDQLIDEYGFITLDLCYNHHREWGVTVAYNNIFCAPRFFEQYIGDDIDKGIKTTCNNIRKKIKKLHSKTPYQKSLK